MTSINSLMIYFDFVLQGLLSSKMIVDPGVSRMTLNVVLNIGFVMDHTLYILLITG